MDKKFLEKAKEKLNKEKALLEKELLKFAEKDKTLKGDWDTKFPDIGMETTDDSGEDTAKRREEYERLLPVEYAMENKLQDIETALEKIEKNKYGQCEKCGKKIPEERLAAIPEARFCRDCEIEQKK